MHTSFEIQGFARDIGDGEMKRAMCNEKIYGIICQTFVQVVATILFIGAVLESRTPFHQIQTVGAA